MRGSVTSRSNFKIQIPVMSLVSALDKNDNLESLENSPCSILVSGFTYCHVNSYVTKLDTRDLLS